MKVKCLNKGLVRIPRYPIEYLYSVLELNNMKEIMDDELFKEAIYLASEDFYSIIHEKTNNDFNLHNKTSKVYLTLLKYYSRMCTRPTPFGLFSGCSIWKSGDITDLKIDWDLSQKHIQLNTLHRYYIMDYLLSIPEFLKASLFCVNNTYYKCGNKIRFLDFQIENGYARYFFSEIEYNANIMAFLRSIKRTVSYESIKQYFTTNGYSDSDSEYIRDKLIKNGLVISEFRLVVNFDDIKYKIKSIILNINDNSPIMNQILEFIDEYIKLTDLDQLFLDYRSLTQKAKVLFPFIDLKSLFCIDLSVKMKNNILGESVCSKISNAVPFLVKYFEQKPSQNLSEFKKKFEDRFGEQSVSLLNVFDADIGLGYPINNYRKDNFPLIEGLKLNNKFAEEDVSLSTLQIVLLKKIIKQEEKYDILSLNYEDLVDVPVNQRNINKIMSIYFEYALDNKTNGDTIHIQLLAPNPMRMISRFANSDNEIKNLYSEIIKKDGSEKLSSKIMAEIKFYNPSNGFNVIVVPHIGEFEIDYFSNSNEKKSILASDILISIKDNKFYLYSKSLKKEIIPTLTSAHNYYMNDVPIYRFLCDISTANMGSTYMFNWGKVLSILDYVPRVEFNGIILSLAIWIIELKDILPIFLIKDDEDFMKNIDQFIRSRNMPRFMIYSDPFLDNRLFIDFKSLESVRILYSIVHSKTKIELHEHLANFTTSPIVDKEGKHYLNEFIMPISIL